MQVYFTKEESRWVEKAIEDSNIPKEIKGRITSKMYNALCREKGCW